MLVFVSDAASPAVRRRRPLVLVVAKINTGIKKQAVQYLRISSLCFGGPRGRPRCGGVAVAIAEGRVGVTFGAFGALGAFGGGPVSGPP